MEKINKYYKVDIMYHVLYGISLWKGEAMQESRLFKIVYYLLEKGKATAPELAEKFEVSVRTIYRDIDALSGAGIPIYTEAGRNGGIHLMDDFVLDKTVLSVDEMQSASSSRTRGSSPPPLFSVRLSRQRFKARLRVIFPRY